MASILSSYRPTKRKPTAFISTVVVASVLTVICCKPYTNLAHAQSTASPDNDSKQRAAWQEAVAAAKQAKYQLAVKHANAAIAAGLNHPTVFYLRGRWNFRIDEVQASLNDFDRFLELAPQRSNSLWERGITCYYAKAYQAGARQFVDYQEYHDNDVENAVWRYLCQLQFDGKPKAQASILPIPNDSRVPMMEVYRLFKGELTPQDVLDALQAKGTEGVQGKHEKFDAHLYLGLYFDSENDLKSAMKHTDLAVAQFKQGDYMWAVAVEHQKSLKRRMEREKSKTNE